MAGTSKDDFIAAKKKEKLIGFSGYRLVTAAGACEGMLNISERLQADGSGTLTLMFLTDVAEDRKLRSAVQVTFKSLDFGRLIGTDLMTVVKTSVELEESGEMVVVEYTFYFAELEEKQHKYVAGLLFPELKRQMNVVFSPVDWVDGRTSSPDEDKKLFSKFKRLLGR